MTINKSYAGTAHVKTLANAALTRPDGIVIKTATEGEAIKLRHMFNQVRHKDRQDSRKIYPAEDHPMHGASVYDSLTTKIEKSEEGYLLRLFPVMAGLAELEIIDPATGEAIKPEEL